MMFLYIIPEYMTSLSVHLLFVSNNFLVSNITFLCSVDLFFCPHYILLYLSFGLPYYGIWEGGPKIMRIFFLEVRGAVLPSAPTRCAYVTALHISWPSSVLEERCIGSVWFFSRASVIVFVNFSMTYLKEQRVCIKICFLLGKTGAETVTMLWEAFKEEALSQTKVYEWLSRFKRGDI